MLPKSISLYDTCILKQNAGKINEDIFHRIQIVFKTEKGIMSYLSPQNIYQTQKLLFYDSECQILKEITRKKNIRNEEE